MIECDIEFSNRFILIFLLAKTNLKSKESQYYEYSYLNLVPFKKLLVQIFKFF